MTDNDLQTHTPATGQTEHPMPLPHHTHIAPYLPGIYSKIARQLASSVIDHPDETRAQHAMAAKLDRLAPYVDVEAVVGRRQTATQLKAKERLEAFKLAVNELELPMPLKSIQAALVPQAWSATYVRDQLREVAVCRADGEGLYLWHRQVAVAPVQVPAPVESCTSPEPSEPANQDPAVQVAEPRAVADDIDLAA